MTDAALSSLNPKQQRFVEEYLVDLNATKAALRCGYAAVSAQVQGSRLLSNDIIASAIAARQGALAAETGISQQRVLLELGKVAFSDIGQVVSWGTRDVPIGYDADGKRLPVSRLDEAVIVHHEHAPFVDAVESADLPDHVRASVSEVTLTKDGLKIKMHDKLGALTQIARHLGMFKDKLELSGTLTLEALVLEAIKPRPIEGTSRVIERDDED